MDLTKKKKSTILIGVPLLLVLIYSLTSFVVNPIYVKVSSDILYMYGALPNILDVTKNALFLIGIIISVSGVALLTYNKTKSVYLLIGLITITYFYNYISNGVGSWISAKSSIQDIGKDILVFLIYIAFDLLYLVAALISVPIVRAADKGCDLKSCNVFTVFHPRAISAFSAAVLVAIVRVISRIIYDVNLGAPTEASEVLTMILYYMLDLLIGFICYLAVYFIVKKQSK